MREGTCRIDGWPSSIAWLVLLGLLTGGAAWADNDKPATGPNRRPFNFLLTQAEIRSLIGAYETRTGEVLTAPILEDEVLVTAPGVVVPMRDRTQEVWGGIAAPLWAIRNPTQSWRILLPIPPKGEPAEAEPPVPDPR